MLKTKIVNNIHKYIGIFCIFLAANAISAEKARSAAYAVASAHPLATSAGEAVLSQGGNAFDAAVAVSAALAVVEPFASGLGGGGFWLLHVAETGHNIMVDGRETAPSEAYADMYLDENNEPVPGKSLNGPIASGIPGTPATLVHLTTKYGQQSLVQNLAPAIALAQRGFKIDQRLARILQYHQEKLARFPNTAQIFLSDKTTPAAGKLLRQPQLAVTLQAIANSGMRGFYEGPVAQELVRAVRASGGLWRKQDLSNYQVVERKPVQFIYRDARITSASLPSASGLTLAQAFNIFEHCDLANKNQYQQAHIIAEALRLTYKDRVKLLGDSDFVQVPVKKLLSKRYARKQAALIDPEQAGTSHPEQPVLKEGTETTHFSIIDEAGNRVAATMSINTFFGSGFVAGSTGVLLNNEMDDFTVSEHAPNIYGLYGSRANAIAPGKRPLSSMSPTFIENEKGILIAGTPGGSRIISTLLLTILDYINNGQMDPQKLVAQPRFHHQYLPDYIQVEPKSFDSNWMEALQSKGHEVREMGRKWGNMQLILYNKDLKQARAASDPRGSIATHY